MTRKLTKEQWAYEINRSKYVRDVQRSKMRKAKYQYFEGIMSRLMPLPVILGVIAMILLFALYGWREFLKFLLSWIVSLTLVATGAYYLWKTYEKRL